MTATQTETLLQKPEQHSARNSIPENSLKCTALCPLFGRDESGRMICRLRALQRYDDKVRVAEGLAQNCCEALTSWPTLLP